MDFLLRMLQGSEVNCDNFAPACITDISTLSNLILPMIYLLAALALLGLFIRAGFKYIMAQGEPAKIKEAQQTITYAILGMIVVAAAFFLVRVIALLFDIPFLL